MKPNLNKIDEISEGDLVFKQKMIDILKKEFPEEKSNYHYLIENGKYEECSKLIHKIKHKINILDLKNGYIIAQNFEVDLKNNKLELKENFDEILSVINTFIKTL